MAVNLKSISFVLLISFLAYLLNQPASNSGIFYDFSNINCGIPKKVVNITDPFDMVVLLKNNPGKVHVRGAGHSMLGLAVSNHTLLLNNNKKHLQIVGENEILVSSGYSIGELEKFANQHNLHITCLQDQPVFSVGGTIAVGGIGWDSYAHGMQINWVTQVGLILPSGEKINCSRTENQVLFNFTLAGLGQTGYIDHVTYQAVPLLKYWKIFQFDFVTVAEVFKATKEVIQLTGIEIFHAGKHRESKHISMYVGKRFATKEESNKWSVQLQSSTSVKVHSGDSWLGKWDVRKVSSKQLWSDYGFSTMQGVESFLFQAFGISSNESFHSHHQREKHVGYFAFYLIKKQNFGSPLSYTQDVPYTFSVGIYLSGNSDKPFYDLLQSYTKISINLGAKPYNYGYNPLMLDDCHNIYGENFNRFRILKKQLDEVGNWIKSNASCLTL